MALVGRLLEHAGQSESPVFLTVSIDFQPGFINIANVAPVQINTITLASKRRTRTRSTRWASPTCSSTVHGDVPPDGRRDDRAPDADLRLRRPRAHDGDVHAVELSGPVRRGAPQAPFDQLLPFNGGIDRETGRNEIDMSFSITFYGTTVSGKRVQSETASGILLFNYSAVAPARLASKGDPCAG